MSAESELARLAFVGYGSEEIFPSCYEVGLEGVYFGFVRWISLNRADVKEGFPYRGSKAQVVLLAQSETISAFITGIHSEFEAQLNVEVEQAVLDETTPRVADTPGAEMNPIRLPQNISHNVYLNLEQRIQSFKNTQTLKTLSLIALQSEFALERLARSLVSMEILATLKTSGLATVGGRVTSAIITLGQGVRITESPDA
jgi:hypothetical protein